MTVLVLDTVYVMRTNLHASTGVLAFSLMFRIVLGVVGGPYPAWRAVRMSPRDAIRMR